MVSFMKALDHVNGMQSLTWDILNTNRNDNTEEQRLL